MQVAARPLAFLLAALLLSGCPHQGMVLTYGADNLPKPSPDPRDLIPPKSPSTPDMATGRSIQEVDCSKPVDLSKGNIRCK